MIARTFQISALAAVGLLTGLGLGQAQSAEPSTEDSASDNVEAAEPARSPEVILSEAQAALDRLEASADNIGRMLRPAREDKDVVKTLCLDDKLNQMNVATRSAADRVESITVAVKSNNTERLQHDDAVLTALKVRANELGAEANQCIGEESGTLGTSSLEVVIDPSTPSSDTASPPPPTVISSPPVAASPTR